MRKVEICITFINVNRCKTVHMCTNTISTPTVCHKSSVYTSTLQTLSPIMSLSNMPSSHAINAKSCGSLWLPHHQLITCTFISCLQWCLNLRHPVSKEGNKLFSSAEWTKDAAWMIPFCSLYNDIATHRKNQGGMKVSRYIFNHLNTWNNYI